METNGFGFDWFETWGIYPDGSEVVTDTMVNAACFRAGQSYLTPNDEEWKAMKEIIRWALANAERQDD